MEGMRLLLTPFPQQQFNQTDDRKVDAAQPGRHLPRLPCQRPHQRRLPSEPGQSPAGRALPLDTVSLRGLFNQQIHGSKRSLRSVEDFTEFEQRTAYFDGDQVTADQKRRPSARPGQPGGHDGADAKHVDFPPAPKSTASGR